MPRPSATHICCGVGIQGHRDGCECSACTGIVTVLHRGSDAYNGACMVCNSCVCVVIDSAICRCCAAILREHPQEP